MPVGSGDHPPGPEDMSDDFVSSLDDAILKEDRSQVKTVPRSFYKGGVKKKFRNLLKTVLYIVVFLLGFILGGVIKDIIFGIGGGGIGQLLLSLFSFGTAAIAVFYANRLMRGW